MRAPTVAQRVRKSFLGIGDFPVEAGIDVTGIEHEKSLKKALDGDDLHDGVRLYDVCAPKSSRRHLPTPLACSEKTW